jgi:signal transduction histidine kinase
MNHALADVSSACALSAAALGCVQASRAGLRRHTAWVQALAFVLTAAWTVSVSLYLRQPFSPPHAVAALALLALALGAWPATALALGEPSRVRLWSRWGAPLIVLALWSAACAAVLATRGVDWLTGIGSQPLIILSRAGLAGVGAAGVPALAAVGVLAWQLAPQWARMPRLLVGVAGAAASQLALWAYLLVYGFVDAGLLTSLAALSATAALVWMVGLVREVPAAPRVALSRRLVYGAVATALAAAYTLAAGAAVGWMRFLALSTAGEMLPALAFLGGALLLVAWARWRQPLWVAINRHVFGSKYDYGEVWIRLAGIVSGARGSADLVQRTAAFCRQLLGDAEVSVWLADSAGNLRRAAAVPEGMSGGAAGGAALSPAALVSGHEAELASATRSSFACSVKVGERLLGVVAAGAAQRPASLDEEDRELLRHVSAQLAGALGIYRLGEELADARELASFHRLSGFVIHDLKNLAVQQSFVLENARRHGQDPRFIADALAAFEDSTQRMRTLIGKLRPRAASAPAPPSACDIAEVVRELLSTPGLANAPGCEVQSVLPADGTRCMALIDRAALLQVLNHLMVNAVESLTPDEGRVAVAVRRAGDGAWRVEVSDNGCGMSEEYLREHAFRPFRTTKRGGLGVGLYQCKTIVEAAGGSIALASTPQSGTTVSITLPGCRETAAALDQVA